MNILITGASGFLGTIVVKKLLNLNYNLTSIGISESDDIYCNLATTIPNINDNYDWIFHIAGKAHVVPKSIKESNDFFKVNVEGTKNLLKGFEVSKKHPKSIVFISSIAVYGLDKGENIDENHECNATDPYGQSKLQAENILLDWGLKHNVRISILRPSLIVGYNAPGNLKALINGIKSGRYLNIDKGKARISMVLADDLALFLPTIAQYDGIYHITDGIHPSLFEISTLIASHFGKKKIINIPYSVAKIISKICDLIQRISKVIMPINSVKLRKITSTLTFDDTKLKSYGWKPRSIISNSQLWLK